MTASGCTSGRSPTPSGNSARPTADTLSARVSLAGAYLAAGQAREAITAYQRALADQELAAGADDPATLAARASLAAAYRVAGKTKEALGAYERVLADIERVLGADHPDTIAARGNLGYAFRAAGRLKDAIPQYERVVADRERLLRGGPPRHDRCARHPRGLLPAGPAAAGGDRDLRAGARRQRAGTWPRRPRHADRPGATWPTAFYEAGRMTEGSRCCAARSPTASATWGRTTR